MRIRNAKCSITVFIPKSIFVISYLAQHILIIRIFQFVKLQVLTAASTMAPETSATIYGTTRCNIQKTVIFLLRFDLCTKLEIIYDYLHYKQYTDTVS
jgi:hypothetical protein